MGRIAVGIGPHPSIAGTDDCYLHLNRRYRRHFMMMDMSNVGSGMMIAMGVYHLAIFAFALLGIAASIKYLRS
jgi:hypothetical protein